jgi:cellulose synthase/poly-beta-1,6-N-acetylglucosamine synthase-like glycosyltransferase
MDIAIFSYGVATLAAASIFYMVFGYPLVLAFGKRPRTAPPVGKDLTFQPTVTALVAVYNGASQVARKLDALLALDYPKDKFDIVVVSDGSTDDTDALVEAYAARVAQTIRITLVRAPRGGKAAALNCGLPFLTGELVFFTDVRQPLETSALRHLAANFADPTIGAVTGELVLLRGDGGEQADMDLYWRYEIWARTRQSEVDSLFNTTGCIYAMRRSLVEPLPPDTLTDDAVMPLRAFFQGYRVVFDPAAKAYDYPAVSGTEFRRRFRTLAGLWQVFARFPALFTSRNRMRFHFLSHKFSRLALPWALLLLLAATLSMPSNIFRNVLLCLEMLPVVLALLNNFIPTGVRLKRLSSPSRTFLVMNAAALCAVFVFVLPATWIWKPTNTAK